jgi:hypothetical protein
MTKLTVEQHFDAVIELLKTLPPSEALKLVDDFRVRRRNAAGMKAYNQLNAPNAVLVEVFL